MQPKPVEQGHTPAYPTRREVLVGAATFVLANFAGCWRDSQQSAAGATIVGPVFAHGEGRGAAGCVVVSPPVFLSEEEAMQVIREELGKHGIQLQEAQPLKSILIPQRTKEWEVVRKADGTAEPVDKYGNVTPLKPNGIDLSKKIAVLYLSFKLWQEEDPFGARTGRGTVDEFDFKDAAVYVVEQVTKRGKEPLYFGVFYDPAVPFAHDTGVPWKKLKEQGKAEARKLVHEQVQDFVTWLKQNNAIP